MVRGWQEPGRGYHLGMDGSGSRPGSSSSSDVGTSAAVVVRRLVALGIVAAVVLVLADNWSPLRVEIGRIPPLSLALAALVGLVSPWVSMLGWRRLLAALGSPLTVRAAAPVFLPGQLAKYLPGSVWTIVVQADLASRLGVPRRRTAVVSLVSMVLSIAVGAVIGLPALPQVLNQAVSATTEGAGSVDAATVALTAAAALGALSVMLWPRGINAALSRLLARAGRPGMDRDLRTADLASVMGWFAAAWLGQGLTTMVLVRSLAPEIAPATLVVTTICGTAVTTALGMAAIVAPAGVGVREGTMLLVLSAIMPLAAAGAVVVVLRFLQVAVDVLMAAGAWWWGRRRGWVARPETGRA